MAAILVAALGCIVAAVPPAAAELQAANLSGRWTQLVTGSKQPLTYDLVRCGEVWCGVEVRNGKDCGHTAIRLDAGAAHEHDVEFFGRYEKAQGTAPYMVSAVLHLTSQKDQLQLSIRGNTGGTFEAYRRTFPFYMALKREGEPTCRADPKLS